MQRIGIYSGTFDPIHDGHVAFAVTALESLGLEKVLFYPEPQPRNKQNVSSLAKRETQIARQLVDVASCSVALLPDRQFTVRDTLPKLQRLFPAAELTILMGSDVAGTLADWPNIHILLSSCPIAIGIRSGDDENSLRAYLNDTYNSFAIEPKFSFHYTHFHHVRSSQLRNSA